MRTEKEELLRSYCRARDPALRNQLAEAYLYLARVVARRFQGRGADLEDLVQVASMALLQAIDRFDCSKGLAFTTFAVPTLAGAVRNYLRDRTHPVRVPRRGMELLGKIGRARELFWAEQGREPSVAELSEAVSASMDEVLGALEMRRQTQTVSLDVQQDEDTPALSGLLGQEEPAFEEMEQSDLVRSLLDELSEPLRNVIELRYFRGESQREVARNMGISQMQVSRLERRALESMRARGAVQ